MCTHPRALHTHSHDTHHSHVHAHKIVTPLSKIVLSLLARLVLSLLACFLLARPSMHLTVARNESAPAHVGRAVSGLELLAIIPNRYLSLVRM